MLAASSASFLAPDRGAEDRQIRSRSLADLSSALVMDVDDRAEFDDDLRPARGIGFGIVAGLAFWLPVIAFLVR